MKRPTTEPSGSQFNPPGFQPNVLQRPLPTHGRTRPGDASRIDTHAPTINVIEYRFSTFSVNAIGTSINTAFPLAKRMATYQFSANAAIIGISLTSATTNITAGLAGVFILTDAAQTQIAIQDDVNCIISHVSFQNALAGSPVSANRTNGVVFGDNTAMKINAGSSIGIYMCAGNDAGNLLAATVSMTWVPIA